ncbi:MAG: hypothetical protein KA248_01955 [Kiritimatiellae bacterium]|nr:hypothetical protein [Kiritimatiellia bacterium]
MKWKIGLCGAVVLGVCGVGPAVGESTWQERLDLAVQSQVVFQHDGFTDVVDPYDGVDAWLEAKLVGWFDAARRVGAYFSLVPTYASVDEFFWSRHVDVAGGVQYYPLYRPESATLVNPLRLYGQVVNRAYYDRQGDTEGDLDWQVGADLYWDNLGATPVTLLLYQNAALRRTNFSQDDYEALLWNGNVKAGPSWFIGDALILPHVILDHAWAPDHEDRWWENYVRLGVGLQWYPASRGLSDQGDFVDDIARRFHLFVEGVQNVSWLGDEPPESVDETDIRAGLAFSSGLYFRD